MRAIIPLFLFSTLLVAVKPDLLGLGTNIINSETYLPVFDGELVKITYKIPKSDLSTYALVIDQMSNYTDDLSIHVEGNAKFWVIKASLSGDYNKVQNEVSKKHHKVASVSSQLTLMFITVDIYSAKLNPGFEDLVYRMSNSADKNTNASKILAEYYANEIIRLYGTHVYFKVMTGASVSQKVTIDTNKLLNYNSEDFKASASVGLSTFFDMKGNMEKNSTRTKEYATATTNVMISSVGGLPWHTNWTYNDWVDTISDNPAVIGKYVIALSDLIMPRRFPNATASSMQRTLEVFDTAIRRHAKDNTHKGCMDPSSTSYSYRVNIEDDLACSHNITFNYGGSYQVSNNNKHILNNILTQTTSCPSGFDAHALIPAKTISYSVGTDIKACFSRCDTGRGSISKQINRWLRCIAECKKNAIQTQTYTVQSFTCLAKYSNHSVPHGIYFGGAYTGKVPNIVTGIKNCQSGFTPQTIVYGITLCEAVFDAGSIVDSGVNSGGFITGYAKNPYTNDYFCPTGYERHSLGKIMDGGEFAYCIGNHDLSGRRKFIPAGYGDHYPSFIEIYNVDNKTYYPLSIDIPETYEEQLSYIQKYVDKIDHNNGIDLQLGWKLAFGMSTSVAIILSIIIFVKLRMKPGYKSL